LIYYYRDKEKREIDLVIEQGAMLHPIEIKTSSDPKKEMVKSFEVLDKIPGKKRGTGAVICLAKERLPLMEDVWIVPARMI